VTKSQDCSTITDSTSGRNTTDSLVCEFVAEIAIDPTTNPTGDHEERQSACDDQ